MPTNPVLRALADCRDRQIQKARIQFGNRLSALERGADDAAGSRQHEILTRWHERFQELEAELDGDIAELVREESIYEHLSAVKGIGPILAAKLISMIDIERATTVSALWRYAGYAVIDGERERPTKGEKLHYNKRLKTAVYLVGRQFLMCDSPYRRIYYTAKDKYETTRPDWTPKHRDLAARRRMVKVFLNHLWDRWRRLEGLPTRALYVQEHLGHDHVSRPEEFGWPEL